MNTNIRRKMSLFAATAVALAAVATAIFTAGTAGAESNGGVRLMPLGDSITEGTQVPGGYRTSLWQKLAAGGYRIDFVGSQFNGPGNLGDHDHEGHPGWRIDQIDANIVTWLRTYNPRTVLLHIGTNDVLQNYNVANAPSRLSSLIDHITTTAPNAEIFVATIIPLSNSAQENAARTFNAALPGIVQSKAGAGKHVHLVDMHSALSTADLIDGVHPTATGYGKMATVWYNALRTVPGSISGGTTPTTPTSPPTNTTDPAPGGCTASYHLGGDWGSGFQAEVTVHNSGSSTLNGWTVRMTLSSGQTITNIWGGVNTGSAGAISVKNAPYNGNLATNTSTTFGYIASGSGSAAPTGVTCISGASS